MYGATQASTILTPISKLVGEKNQKNADSSLSARSAEVHDLRGARTRDRLPAHLDLETAAEETGVGVGAEVAGTRSGTG
ncbi:MAG: hypothetical protein R2862_05540 [Thermoanaerobaculia bacterium]